MKNFCLNKYNINIEKFILIISSIIQIISIYVIIREVIPKLVIIIFILPLIILNFYFYDYIKTRLPKLNTKKSKIKYWITIITISIIFYKSIMLKGLFINKGIMTIPYILGMVLWFVQFVLIITCLLERINITNSTNKNKWDIILFAIPSLAIFTLVYFIYFPGLCSADSLYVWTQVGKNIYSDAHPIVYMFLIKGLRLIWDDIAVVALFQILLCSFTFGFIVNELRIMGVPKWLCWVIAIILPAIPANTMYAVTFWKDVPYTMGLLILCILLLRCITSNYYNTKKALPQIFLISLFTLFMRHNALVSVIISLFILGLYYIFRKDKKLIIKTLILGICLVVSYFGIKNIIFCALETSNTSGEYTGKSFVKFNMPTTIASQQIIYTQDVAGTSFTQDEIQLFDKYFNIDKLQEHKQKYTANNIWQFYHKPNETLNHKAVNQFRNEFWRYYFKLWRRFPKSMIGGYERITSICWASSSFGSVAYRGTVDCYVKGLDLYEYRPIIKNGMNYKLDKSIFAYKDSSIACVLWRPAFAFILMLLLMYVAAKRHGAKIILFALPVILNQLTYFIVIASQDTRYTYVNYTMFIIMFVLSVMKSKSIGDNK